MNVNDSFHATRLQANGSVLVAVHGEIDINTAGAFAAAIPEAAGWSQQIFVDLQDVYFIGVAGVRALQLVLCDMEGRWGTGEIVILAPPTSLMLMATVVELPTGLTISTATNGCAPVERLAHAEVVTRGAALGMHLGLAGVGFPRPETRSQID